jgi:hypothetical protein
MEAAFRRMDPTRRSLWHALAPDEALMLAEDGPGECGRRAEIQEALLAFLFADGAGDWRKVAVRAVRVLKDYAPSVAQGLAVAAEAFQGFGLRELRELVDDDREIAAKLLGWFFQERGPSALRDGCQRVYLIAKAFQGQLLTEEAGEMGFEEMARAFGELTGNGGGKQGARSRSRWSARAEKMIRKPMEAGTGCACGVDLFGKMSATREKYREAAVGNKNRRKTQDARRQDARRKI